MRRRRGGALADQGQREQAGGKRQSAHDTRIMPAGADLAPNFRCARRARYPALVTRALRIASALLLGACASAPASAPPPAPQAPRRAAAPAPAPETPAGADRPAEPEPPPRALGPLSPELRERLLAIRADPPPPATTRNRHYFVSNENQHHLWRDAVSGLGGIQIGVGTEQNYLLAGWSRPEVLVLLDFDQWVVDLNWVYGLVFEHSASPDELIDAWRYRSRERVRGWIHERWPEPPELWRKLRAFEKARPEVHARLERLRQRHQKLGVPSFVDDQAEYDYVAGLWRLGRAISVRGNLVEATTLADVAAFAERAQLPVRVLYLSNAEDYFDYGTGSYRRNVLGLPFDAKSVVLHTKPRDGSYYRYLAQSADNYRAWIASGRARSFCELFAHAEPARGREQPDLYRLTAAPETAPAISARCPRE